MVLDTEIAAEKQLEQNPPATRAGLFESCLSAWCQERSERGKRKGLHSR
jgi:hypothetical protein